MGNFNRDSRRSGGGFNRGFDRNKSFGGKRRSGGRDGDRPSMHQATCSECGQDCEIPFKPSNGRPVFCSKCFEKQSGSSSSSRPMSFGGERRERFNFDDKQMHSAVCAKCGKDCQVPFRPSAGKPVFCDNCFGKGGNDALNKGVCDTKDSGEVMQQIKMLNTKIDQLIKILTPNALSEKAVKANKLEKKSENKVEDKSALKEKTKSKVAAKKVSRIAEATAKQAAKKKK